MIGRPLGLMRIASDRCDWGFPFQRTLDKRRFAKVLSAFRHDGRFNIEPLVEILMQNAGVSLARLGEFLDEYKRQVEALSRVPDDQIIHGKDLTFILGDLFSSSFDEITRMLAMCLAIDGDRVRQCPNVERVLAWLRIADRAA